MNNELFLSNICIYILSFFLSYNQNNLVKIFVNTHTHTNIHV